jgi:hypothetical protein
MARGTLILSSLSDTHKERKPYKNEVYESVEGNLLTISRINSLENLAGSTSELDAIVETLSEANVAETESTHSDARTIMSEDQKVQRVIEEETSEVGRVRT